MKTEKIMDRIPTKPKNREKKQNKTLVECQQRFPVENSGAERTLEVG